MADNLEMARIPHDSTDVSLSWRFGVDTRVSSLFYDQ